MASLGVSFLCNSYATKMSGWQYFSSRIYRESSWKMFGMFLMQPIVLMFNNSSVIVNISLSAYAQWCFNICCCGHIDRWFVIPVRGDIISDMLTICVGLMANNCKLINTFRICPLLANFLCIMLCCHLILVFTGYVSIIYICDRLYGTY